MSLQRIALNTPREIMIALLCGGKLQHANYRDDEGDMYIYLDSDSGHFCEEDGAGAKPHRVNVFSFWKENPKWELLLATPDSGDAT